MSSYVQENNHPGAGHPEPIIQHLYLAVNEDDRHRGRLSSPGIHPPRRSFKKLHKTDAMQESKLSNLHFIAGTQHVRNLSKELETTSPPKRPTKPPAPSDHFISTVTEEFQQSLLEGNTEDIQTVLKFYDLQLSTCLDFLRFDRTELMKLVQTACKSIKPNPKLLLLLLPILFPTYPTSKPSASKCLELNSPNGVV